MLSSPVGFSVSPVSDLEWTKPLTSQDSKNKINDYELPTGNATGISEGAGIQGFFPFGVLQAQPERRA
jgi:hypothetical protein